MNGAEILDDLEARGLIQDTTDRDALAARLAEGPITVYCGFDPTSDSLHVGNLIPLLILRRFQDAGHNPIVLAGGATGMIGDPSGRSSERNLLDDERLAANLETVVPQLRRFVSFEGEHAAQLFDNRAWTVGTDIIDFLRDVGKYVTVNAMLAKESVKTRMASDDGISFTEFSYMLLQANDFVNLNELTGCEMQVGGSDQWGNIALGVDMTRRRLRKRVHALSCPLLLKPDGEKYGKTASGEQVWLSSDKVSPYRFFQAWMQAEDGELPKLLRQLTLLPLDEIDDLIAAHDADPGRRLGQRGLADALTALVHGREAAEAAAAASSVLFGGDVGISEQALEMLCDEIPTSEMDLADLDDGADLIDVVVDAGLASSKGDARRTIEQRGFSVNGVKAENGRVVTPADLLHGRYVLLRRGKNRYHLVVVAT